MSEYEDLIFNVENDNLDIVKYLVSKGVDIHTENDRALRLSAENGHLDIVKYLVKKGADIHAENDEALIYSAENGHLEVVKYLVSKGANIHADNDIALRLSAENGHLEVVKYLVSKGADIHANNDIALGVAASTGNLQIVKYLVNKGAKVNAADNFAIGMAASNGHLGVVKYLVSKGSNFRANNFLALRLSAENGHLAVVKYLVTQGEYVYMGQNINTVMALSRASLETPLLLSSKNGNLDIVKYLVKKGVNIHVENDKALKLSVKNGNFEVVKYLVNQGIISRKNMNDAIDIANKYNQDKIADFLKSKIPHLFKAAVKKIIDLNKNKKIYYKWEKFCSSIKTKDLKQLVNLAKLQGIKTSHKDLLCEALNGNGNGNGNCSSVKDLVKLAKSQGIKSSHKDLLCEALKKKYQRKMERKLNCENDTTISGDDISLIPKPLLYTVRENGKNFCFNIMDLIAWINTGHATNPYTRSKLDINAIKIKFKKLQKILLKDKLALTNILDEIKNNKIMTRSDITLLNITNLVSLLNYHPPVEAISQMTPQQFNRLKSLMNENPLLSTRAKNLQELVLDATRLLNIQDANQATRKAAFEIYLNDIFSGNGNGNGNGSGNLI